MAKVTFNEDKCKGCMLCVTACPKKIVVIAKDRINKKGFNPATVIEQDKCIGCASCGYVCPDGCITVYKVKL